MLAGAAALVALLAPASALAGTYSWAQPGDFSGSNPEMKYGQASWAYYQGTPGHLSALTCTASGCSGGGDSVSVSAGKLVLQAAASGAVTIVWTNPFTSNQSVTISPSFTFSGLLCGPPTVTPNGTTTLAPGATVTISLSGTALNSCSATGTIGISASVSAPSLSVTSPSSGATVTAFQQSFAGSASSGFGISNLVMLRVYSGSSASGTPVETLSTTESGGSWSVPSNSALPNGQYTTQAEQDDLVGDQGFSTPVTFTIAHPPPSVSLTSPSPGATVTGLPRTSAGTASSGFGISDQVTVRVYSGSSASGSPVETLSTTQSGGSWSVSSDSLLANGQYTVQAEQDDLVGDQGFSAPVTFTVAIPAPTVSLDSPGSAPLQAVTPTLTGTASTRSFDSDQVTVDVYPGTNLSAPPIRAVTASIGSGGRFSALVQPALPDGQYTSVATQGSSVGPGSSRPVAFRVKVNSPALTLSQPSADVTLNDRTPTFSGRAGDALGDSPTVTVYLYKGSGAGGNPVGDEQVKPSGSDWSVTWAHPLAYAQYTVVAVQGDDAGHTSRTSPKTFTVAPTPALIGSAATLSRTGQASVSVGCLAGPGQSCTGTVLIVTRHSYRTTAGGPTGPLEVLFAKVQIGGGQALVIHRSVGSAVLRVLLRLRHVPVEVTVSLSGPPRGSMKASADRVLELRR